MFPKFPFIFVFFFVNFSSFVVMYLKWRTSARVPFVRSLHLNETPSIVQFMPKLHCRKISVLVIRQMKSILYMPKRYQSLSTKTMCASVHAAKSWKGLLSNRRSTQKEFPLSRCDCGEPRFYLSISSYIFSVCIFLHLYFDYLFWSEFFETIFHNLLFAHFVLWFSDNSKLESFINNIFSSHCWFLYWQYKRKRGKTIEINLDYTMRIADDGV